MSTIPKPEIVFDSPAEAAPMAEVPQDAAARPGAIIEERCETCRFFRTYLSDGKPGECRRYAPRPVLGRLSDHLAFYPDTYDDDWCGEYQPKAPKKADGAVLWEGEMFVSCIAGEKKINVANGYPQVSTFSDLDDMREWSPGYVIPVLVTIREVQK